MMKFMILILIIYMMFFIIQLNHPLALGMILLIQTILISLFLGMSSQSFWFSYILFLIFIGGMLILFIYMTSMASNEMFNFSNKMLFLMNSLFSILFLLTFFLDKNILINNLINNYEMMNLNYLNSFINDHALSLMKLYNFPTNLMTLLLINYLLFTLIIIVKITNSKVGPLRMSFKM